MAWNNVGNIKGPPGENGTDGTDGAAATISVGTTTTGAAGTSASVTNTGTSSAAVFNFTIPKGDQGDPGPPGPSKRIVTMTANTSASGIVTFTYSPAFSATPNVNIMMVTGNTREFTRLTASTATGCTVHAFSQNQTLLSLLGIDILTAGVTNLASRSISIMAVEQ